MPYIKVNGARLHYEEFGTGSKVLLSTQRFFFTGCHMELLAKTPYDYHVYLITMRGYAKSDHVYEDLQKDWTIQWGEDVLALADAIGAKQFYYSGISHGCWAGWYIAMHHANRLLGFCATSGVAQYSHTNKPPIALDISSAQELVGNEAKLRTMSWNCDLPVANASRLARRAHCIKEHYEILLKQTAEEFILRNTNTASCTVQSEEEFYEKLHNITAPVLIINGAHDNLSTPEKALKIALAIPSSQFLLYESLDHGGPDECPEEIARACNRFFSDMQAPLT